VKPFWDDQIAAWVDDRLPHAGPFTNNRAMGVEHKGETVAGFVFHNWDPRTGIIEVSGASENPRWATRAVVREAMSYVFDTCGCQMLFARQHFDNLPARRGWLHLGATETVVPRLFGRGTVGTILWLTDDQWLSSKIARS
jgi:hypothetical protein